MFLQSRRECRTQWSQRSRPVVLKWLIQFEHGNKKLAFVNLTHFTENFKTLASTKHKLHATLPLLLREVRRPSGPLDHPLHRRVIEFTHAFHRHAVDVEIVAKQRLRVFACVERPRDTLREYLGVLSAEHQPHSGHPELHVTRAGPSVWITGTESTQLSLLFVEIYM